MNKVTLVAAITAIAITGNIVALSANAPKKIMLKISTVETIGTRHQKTWNPPSKPLALSEKPYSVLDINNATPEDADRMRRKNEAVEDAQRAANAQIALENWSAADRHMKGVQAQLEGNEYGRQIIIALDKFAAFAGSFFDSDYIEYFHRMDNDEGIKEKLLTEMTSPNVVAAPYFIKLVFDDPRSSTAVVEMNGQEFKNTKCEQGVVYQVQDNSGKMITSGMVKKSKLSRTSNAVQISGTPENDLVDLLEECLQEIAKRINDHFVLTVSFTLVGPKDDDEFDAEKGTIEINGETYNSGDEFKILRGSYPVKVEMEDYELSKTTYSITKSDEIELKMKSTKCKLTITVKGPSGDKEFDAGSAQISVKSNDGQEEFSLSSGEAEQIPHGKYTIDVEMDGYKAKSKKIDLKSSSKKETITMLKDKVKE